MVVTAPLTCIGMLNATQIITYDTRTRQPRNRRPNGTETATDQPTRLNNQKVMKTDE